MKLSKKLSLWFAHSEANQEYEMIEEAEKLYYLINK